MTLLKIMGLFVGISFMVFWVGLVWWVSQDVLTRTGDKIIVAAAVAVTAILGPVGALLYLVIRPKQTIKETTVEMMEREMLLHASSATICPTCGRMAQDDFVSCPHCGTTLKDICPKCAKLVWIDWEHCPYCAILLRPDLKILNEGPKPVVPKDAVSPDIEIYTAPAIDSSKANYASNPGSPSTEPISQELQALPTRPSKKASHAKSGKGRPSHA